MTITYDVITSSIDSADTVDVVCVNLQKASDRVPHEILMQKLEKLNLNLYLVRWLANYLQNRQQIVVINKSSPILVPSGILQGSILGPVLFLLFINDLLEENYSNHIISFADDCKLYGAVNSVSLQSDVTLFLRWCHINGMEVNTSRCHC